MFSGIRRSIHRKLMSIIMLSAALALIMACSAFAVYEFITHRDSAARELEIIAQLVGESTAASLAFDDERSAADALHALSTESRIVAGCLYTRKGEVFASYGSAGPRACPKLTAQDRPLDENGYQTLFHQVRLDGGFVGTLYLRASLTGFWERARRYSLIATGILALTLLVVYLVSSRLQRLISGPILHLAATASQVSDDRNYALRAEKTVDDELGVLVDQFNEMMGTIEARNQDLLDAHNELERRVRERTVALEAEVAERRRVETDLLAAKQIAEASSLAKSRFLANMSHELRTPLNAVIGYAEMLREEAVVESRLADVRDLDRIHAAAKHLLTLINDILDISKIEAGKTVLNWETVEVVSLAREVVNTVEPMARERGNQLIIRGAGLDGTIRADLTKFRQSLLNLLSNACKFTENGEVSLEVTREYDGNQDWMLWKVRDTGIGIPKEQQHLLFQAFSQVDNSASRKYNGSGLGLAISQRFCQMMGGEIQVSSQVGQGSEFTVRMPAFAAEEELNEVQGKNR